VEVDAAVLHAVLQNGEILAVARNGGGQQDEVRRAAGGANEFPGGCEAG
jgi:hypothetical protein